MTKEISVRILPAMVDAATNLNESLEEWLNNQGDFALAVDEGRIFQKVGSDFLKLRITDIKPFDESLGNLKNGEAYKVVFLVDEVFQALSDKSLDFKDWALRMINLGIMSPYMNLYYQEENGEYSQIFLTKKDS